MRCANKPTFFLNSGKPPRFPYGPPFPAPWSVEPIPGGFKVNDANGQTLAYVYAREEEAASAVAKALTLDEARRIASNIAKLPSLLNQLSFCQCDALHQSYVSTPARMLRTASEADRVKHQAD